MTENQQDKPLYYQGKWWVISECRRYFYTWSQDGNEWLKEYFCSNFGQNYIAIP